MERPDEEKFRTLLALISKRLGKRAGGSLINLTGLHGRMVFLNVYQPAE